MVGMLLFPNFGRTLLCQWMELSQVSNDPHVVGCECRVSCLIKSAVEAVLDPGLLKKGQKREWVRDMFSLN